MWKENKKNGQTETEMNFAMPSSADAKMINK